MDLGEPASYLTLEDGTAVFTSEGTEIGRVEHVLADADADVFDGLVIDVRSGPGGHRFADASQVAEIYDDGVVLTLDDGAAAELPEPSANPASLEADPADTAPDDLGDKLKRAWDYLSGNY
jgi:C-terminal processing protease CtpA/Prc